MGSTTGPSTLVQQVKELVLPKNQFKNEDLKYL